MEFFEHVVCVCVRMSVQMIHSYLQLLWVQLENFHKIVTRQRHDLRQDFARICQGIRVAHANIGTHKTRPGHTWIYDIYQDFARFY